MDEAKQETRPQETVTQKATFAAGCFWGGEETFRKVKGVVATAVGYSGGTLPSPTYQDVCSGTTGHAEVVRLEYDPGVVSYEELLSVFWDNHDPTTLNRQGPDVGTQDPSAGFCPTPRWRRGRCRAARFLEAGPRFPGSLSVRGPDRRRDNLKEPAAALIPAL